MKSTLIKSSIITTFIATNAFLGNITFGPVVRTDVCGFMYWGFVTAISSLIMMATCGAVVAVWYLLDDFF